MKTTNRHEKQLELLKLMREKPFDEDVAARLLAEVGNIDEPIEGDYHYPTTYLSVATEENNIFAVKFLFEHGSNPNLVFGEDNDSPLWDLVRPEDDKDDIQERMAVAKLYFQYGADPNLMTDGETVYDYVTFNIFEHMGDRDWDYLLGFYKILIAYGGGGVEYPKPNLTEPIDKDRIDDYDIRFHLAEDGYHIIGYVITPDGRNIGRL